MGNDAKTYRPTQEEMIRLENNFTYHPPKPGQPERYTKLREAYKALALELLESCPHSRERSMALTELESSVMWANAAIARNE